MDLNRVLEELRRELDYLDSAILSLERLREGAVRRGRPPKVLSELRRPINRRLDNSRSAQAGRQEP